MDKPVTHAKVIEKIDEGDGGEHLLFNEFDGKDLTKREASHISHTKAQMEQSYIVIDKILTHNV